MNTRTRLPPLNALRVLEAIHNTGSVMGAARKLNVSHSAVSHQIKILEAWTPHQLFVREGRRTQLSEAGKSLAGVAHQAFDSIRHEMDRLPIRGTRNVSVASLPLAATEWLLPRLHGFNEQHPGIKLHLSLSQTDRPITPLPDVEIKFALRSQLIAADVELFSGTAAPVCTPQLLEHYGGDAERLLTQGPLIYDEDLRMWARWLERADLNRDETAVASGLIVEGSSMLQSAALAGHGVALCRTACLDRALQARHLVQLSETTIDEDWCYFLRFAAERPKGPEVLELQEWLTVQSRTIRD